MSAVLANRLASAWLICALFSLSSRAAAQADLHLDDDVAPEAFEARGMPNGSAPRAPFVAASESAIREALQRYAREPAIEAVVRATVQAAPPSHAAALASRARTAGWVPRIGLRARRGQGVDLATSQSEDNEALRLSTGDDLTFEATLTFDLDRVVFRSEEVALAREERAENAVNAARVEQVVSLYFERRRLQLERDLGAPASPERSARIAEIETLLNVFTRGEFSRMMRQPRWKIGARTSASRSPSPPRSSGTARR